MTTSSVGAFDSIQIRPFYDLEEDEPEPEEEEEEEEEAKIEEFVKEGEADQPPPVIENVPVPNEPECMKFKKEEERETYCA